MTRKKKFQDLISKYKEYIIHLYEKTAIAYDRNI